MIPSTSPFGDRYSSSGHEGGSSAQGDSSNSTFGDPVYDCAELIQATWRGHTQRRRLPAFVAHLYIEVVLAPVIATISWAQTKHFISVWYQRYGAALVWGSPGKDLVWMLRECGARVIQAAWRFSRELAKVKAYRYRDASSFLIGPGMGLAVGKNGSRLVEKGDTDAAHRAGAADRDAEAWGEAWYSGAFARVTPDMTTWTSNVNIDSTLFATIANAMMTRYFSGDEEEGTMYYPNTKVPVLMKPAQRTHPPYRVHIFFSDTGGGHRASAVALQAAMKDIYGDAVLVQLTDFLREATPWPFSFLPEIYSTSCQYPAVYKTVYDINNAATCWRDTVTYQYTYKYSRERVLTFLSKLVVEGIDLAISVHPLINHMIVDAFRELCTWHIGYTGRRNAIPVVTVITDLGSAHVSWFDKQVDLTFVPSSEIRRLAMQLRVPKDRIRLYGLPVREGFWKPDTRSKLDLRLKLRLKHPPDEQPVVLMMCGGDGFGNVLDVAKCIAKSLAARGKGQLVVICGRNEDVRTSLQEIAEILYSDARILGFTDNVDEYMSAADIFVTKAGPGSIAEAMIKGLPTLLTCFLPGQEEGNVGFVTENMAGAYVSDSEPEKVAELVDYWLEHPDHMARMRASALRLGRPQAASDIARCIGQEILRLSDSASSGASNSPYNSSLSVPLAFRPAPSA